MIRPVEREKLQDCLLLIQSAKNILSIVPSEVAADLADIQKCVHDADLKITALLRA